jgi:hypothetical protein
MTVVKYASYPIMLVSTVSVSVPSSYCHADSVAIDILNCPTKVGLFVCYRPPSYDNNLEAKSYISHLCSCIESVLPCNSTAVIFVDFNFLSIRWSNY